MKVEIQLQEDDPGSIKIVHNKKQSGKEINRIHMIIQSNHLRRTTKELRRESSLEAITSYHKQKPHSKAKKIFVVLESLDTSHPYLFITLLMGIKLMVETKMKH